jgi:hypothetical protein
VRANLADVVVSDATGLGKKITRLLKAGHKVEIVGSSSSKRTPQVDYVTVNDRTYEVSTSKPRKVKFGSVTIKARPPSDEVIRGNVYYSTKALERIENKLSSPGVTLGVKKNVPLYSLDADNPDVMIQSLNGKITRGKLVDGKFRTQD